MWRRSVLSIIKCNVILYTRRNGYKYKSKLISYYGRSLVISGHGTSQLLLRNTYVFINFDKIQADREFDGRFSCQ